AGAVALEAPLATATDRVNEQTKLNLLEKVQEIAAEGDTIAVLGLAYKPDTYIVEESAGLYLAQKLKHLGHRVLVHDYAATPANSPSLHEFEVLEDPQVLAGRAEGKIAVVCCPWPPSKTVRVHPATKILAAWKI